MKATIKIEMDNAAFEEENGREIARILRKLAARVENQNVMDGYQFPLIDVNGNKVGTVEITE